MNSFEFFQTSDANNRRYKLLSLFSYGNTYYENMEEAPNRTRWVDYKSSQYDASQVEPEHAWMRHMVDEVPSKKTRSDGSSENIDAPSWKKPFQPNLTFSRGAYKPYNTVSPSYSAWVSNTKHDVNALYSLIRFFIFIRELGNMFHLNRMIIKDISFHTIIF
ncbi:unnamed protein product [Pneumocystis jirovecii]|uniref:NADH dehydrogenase [ubiquinone] 1 alpha subcomplex subunit n=1 Tax=Pneumocystis jirovecii TaxID=42068 RepID=L0PGA3_PNEJI|nr:unnamed protein product [Pneumocystis jirovecii]